MFCIYPDESIKIHHKSGASVHNISTTFEFSFPAHCPNQITNMKIPLAIISFFSVIYAIKIGNSSYIIVETDNALQKSDSSKFFSTLREIHHLPARLFQNISIQGNRLLFSVGANAYRYTNEDIKHKIEKSLSKNELRVFRIKKISIVEQI